MSAMPRDMSEAQLQKATAHFLDYALTIASTWFHVPNSIRTTPKQAAVHKAFGMKAGAGDCIIISRDVVPLAIELKTKVGRLSAEQVFWSDAWVSAGGVYRVCRSVDDVERALREHRIPLRATAFGKGAIAA